MMKQCVICPDGRFHVGEWDYMIQRVQVGEQVIEPAEYDSEGNLTKEAVVEPIFEDQATNPLPEGAIMEEREFDYDSDRGWYEVGTEAPKTPQQELEELRQQNALMQAAIDDLILNGGGF